MLKIIRNGEVYSPDYLGKKDILLAGNRIAKMADRLPEMPEWLDVEEFDATGLYVTPGFIDGHVHITGGGGEGGFHTRTPEIQLTHLTKAGVTTVVGCLGTDGTTRSIAGLLAKARALDEEGISTCILTGSYEFPVRTLTDHMRDDIILIDKVIGIGELAVSDHRSSQPADQELIRAASEARVGGLLSGKAGVVVIHLGDGRGMFDPLLHIVRTTDIPITQFVPTHVNRSHRIFHAGMTYAQEGGNLDLTTSSDPRWLEKDEIKASKGLKMFLEAGVSIDQITFTSDAQGSLPIFDERGHFKGLGIGEVASLHRELRDAVMTDGVELSEALKVVTVNPARIFRLAAKGQIAEGFDADVVLLDRNLEVDTVFAKGNVMVHKREAVVTGTFEAVTT